MDLTHFLQQLIGVVKAIPQYLTDTIDRQIFRWHTPFLVGDGVTPPVCIRHRQPVPWPCDEAVAAANRLHPE